MAAINLVPRAIVGSGYEIGPPSIQMGVTAGIFLASILLKEMRYLV
jgi:hypothetical protein